jgi:hypothetical protein
VAAYIADCASRLKVGSIQRRLNAIAEAHKAMGLESSTHAAIVANTMKGIRRTKGTAPVQRAPTLTDNMRAMVDANDWGLIGARDRAQILLGFGGAFRRSEPVKAALRASLGEVLTGCLAVLTRDQEGMAGNSPLGKILRDPTDFSHGKILRDPIRRLPILRRKEYA